MTCPACGGLCHGEGLVRIFPASQEMVPASALDAAQSEAARLRRALEWLAMKIADYGSCPLESEWKDAEGNDVCFAGLDGEDCPGPADVWRCYVNAALAAAEEVTPDAPDTP